MSDYEQLIYENHAGKKLIFGDGKGLYVNANDLRDYEWEYSTVNDRIKKFRKKIKNKSLPCVIKGESEADATSMKNKLLEYADVDVCLGRPGRIWVGDYYLSCYVTGSKKSKYNIDSSFVKVDLTITTDMPSWVKEELFMYRTSTQGEDGGYDFPYDFPFDFSQNIPTSIENTNYIDADFRMIIYGALPEVNVQVGSNHYKLSTEVKASEYVLIDSRDKKAVLVDAIGREHQIFNSRDRQYDLFAKIPTGLSLITRTGKVDITLYNERSEPLWT